MSLSPASFDIPVRTPFASQFAGAGLRQQAQPKRPTLLLSCPHGPESFDDLDALAVRVLELRLAHGGRRSERGLDARMGVATRRGFATFPVLHLYVVDQATGADTWIASAAIQGRTPEALKAALQRAEATAPRKAQAA